VAGQHVPYAAAYRRAIAAIPTGFAFGGPSRAGRNGGEKEARMHQIIFSPAHLRIAAIGGVRVKFAKIVFLVAGIYGLLILTPIYFMEGRIGRDNPPAITHPEYFYGFLGAGLAWQVLFLVLSGDPARYRAMILPSVLEKISYGIALLVLYSQQRLAFSVLAIGSVDWIFAFLFLAAYFTTKSVRASA